MLSDTELKRLHWICTHRAQLELDLLLGNFLDKHFSKLNPEQETEFVALAEMEDIELWPLIVGKRKCQNPTQAEVVEMLRNARVV